MKKIKSKEPIRLRQRETKSGNTSLYLDIYFNGRRRYEYLKLYLVPEKTKQDKINNKETLALAEAIKSKRIVELRNGEFGFNSEKSRIKFDDFVLHIINEKSKTISQSTIKIWHACYLSMRKYDKMFQSMYINDIDEQWSNGFSLYLTRNHSGNSASVYFGIFVSIIKEAKRKGYLRNDIIVDRPQRIEVERNFLSANEVQKLINTPCKNNNVKNAFLFSCFTGLRSVDIRAIKWEDISTDGNSHRIAIRQQKTKEFVYIDISDKAFSFMVKNNNKHVFILPCQDNVNTALQKWCALAGITKKITFHCARHTFACLLIELGEDLYTVSKLLGHRNITTTQIYAKVVDSKKKNALKKLGDLF
ncbi:MAG: tyrosine-type recombinase/integrase [Bacillus sp. (in: firmicutes)]